MREIKFRGKRLDNPIEWSYGGLASKGICVWIIEDVLINYLVTADVITHTVGQFTGLKDKNGKEIYEGDIIKNFNGRLDVVEFGKIGYDSSQNGLIGFALGSWYDEEYDYYKLSYGFNFKELEVIGNIHDNKELLNE